MQPLTPRVLSNTALHMGLCQVLLCSAHPASSSLQQCEAHIQDVCNTYWLVKITAAVPEAQAAQAAHAIGKHHSPAPAQVTVLQKQFKGKHAWNCNC